MTSITTNETTKPYNRSKRQVIAVKRKKGKQQRGIVAFDSENLAKGKNKGERERQEAEEDE